MSKSQQLTEQRLILDVLVSGARNGVKIKRLEVPQNRFDRLKAELGFQLDVSGDDIIINGPWAPCAIGTMK
jgi:hypothetical protein